MPTQYPAALDNDVTLHTAVNNFATSLTSAMNDSQTVITVASIANLPSTGIISVDSEVIFYTSTAIVGAAQQILGCTRGADGTTAMAHGSGARVEARWVAEHHNVIKDAIRAVETELGINPKGLFTDVADRLDKSTVTIVPITTPSTNWNFTHSRKRLVIVQLYRKTGANTYEIFDNPIEQIVDPNGVSYVNITLSSATEGQIVYQ